VEKKSTMYAIFTIFAQNLPMESLNSLQNIPINSTVLKLLLGNLKYPRNKISDLEKSNVLIRVKKDLYVRRDKELSKELIANHIYGTSYVSLETALAYYGMIPERVYIQRSITTKRAKTFSTPLGIFEYITVTAPYFTIGIQQEIIENRYAFLIAAPTKAVCDMIVATSNLRLQSLRAMSDYLTEDLRIDFEDAKGLDKNIVKQCIKYGKKRTELEQLLKFINYE
jgi:uncharacterized protein YifN (PemK superfamily)